MVKSAQENDIVITAPEQLLQFHFYSRHKNFGFLGKHFEFEEGCSVAKSKFKGKCRLGHLSYVRGEGSVLWTEIGRYCSIGTNLSCGEADHPNWFSSHPFTYDGSVAFRDDPFYQSIKCEEPRPKTNELVRIGNDVWIGQNVFIKRGITIGDGAMVGACSVVTRDVAPYSVVAGVPARKIKLRFPEKTIKQLLELEWWNYDLASLPEKPKYSQVEKTIELVSYEIKHNNLPELPIRQFAVTKSNKNQVTISQKELK